MGVRVPDVPYGTLGTFDEPGSGIDFLAHRYRPASGGAAESFEQMLALLVQTVIGDDAQLVRANPGDWGIDVLYGDLDGTVRIWQAKYFVNGVGKNQKSQIEDSFASAMKAAQREGHRVAAWVLCVPSSLDAPTRKWWSQWRADQQAKSPGVEIDLWDETVLRRHLMAPAAEYVRQLYYGYRPAAPPAPAALADRARPVATPAATAVTTTWRVGDEIRLDRAGYLLLDEPMEWASADGSLVWRTATAVQLDLGDQPVRIRQVWARRPDTPADQRRSELRAQARLAGTALVELVDRDGATTVVTRQPPGHPWRELYGPADVPPDQLITSASLAAAADVCGELASLHAGGHNHRALGPDDIVVAPPPGRAGLRDLGFAAITASRDDRTSGSRAPEQARPPYEAGSRTDVYQLAGLIYHTLTCHPPGPACPPVRATMDTFPADLDEMLLRCLHVDPRCRPVRITSLRDALRQGRRHLFGSGAS